MCDFQLNSGTFIRKTLHDHQSQQAAINFKAALIDTSGQNGLMECDSLKQNVTTTEYEYDLYRNGKP